MVAQLDLKIPEEFDEIYQWFVIGASSAGRKAAIKYFGGFKSNGESQDRIDLCWAGFLFSDFLIATRNQIKEKKRRKTFEKCVPAHEVSGDEWERLIRSIIPSNNKDFKEHLFDNILQNISKFYQCDLIVSFKKFLDYCQDEQEAYPACLLTEDDLTYHADEKSRIQCAKEKLKQVITDIDQHIKDQGLAPKPDDFLPISPSEFQLLLTDPRNKDRGEYYYFGHRLIEKLVGREKQENILENYLKADADFSWLQIAGGAGQGKSRLALELVIKAKKMGWKAGYIDGKRLIKLAEHPEWQPEQPTLLALEYVIGNVSALKQFLLPFCERIIEAEDTGKNRLRCKVRLLLVGRQPWNLGITWQQKQSSESDFQFNDSRAERSLNLVQSNHAGSINDAQIIEECRFRAEGIGRILELIPLTKSELINIVNQAVIALSDSEIKPLEEKEADDFFKHLQRFDDQNRPLYAYFVARILTDGDSIKGWSRADLLNAVLIREQNIWWKSRFNNQSLSITDTSTPSRLATLATMIGELPYQDIQQLNLISGQSPDTQNDTDLIVRQACALTGSGLSTETAPGEYQISIVGMQPDLLGEWYVLRKLENKTLLTELSQLAWEKFPEAMSVFIQRISQDFWKIETVNALLDNINIHEIDISILSNCANALFVHQYHKQRSDAFGKIVQALEIAVIKNPESSNSKTNLGLCYANGWSVKKNASKAVELYRQAADLGNSQAMTNLAFCYERGDGVEQDWAQAIDLYLQAADLGNSRAMNSLAVCYERGDGVEQDWEQAIDLYRRAVELGDGQAMSNLAGCYKRGDGVKQDWEQATNLYRQAAELGSSQAMTSLAFCYERGEGVEQNWEQAISLYRQAADLGDSIAMTNLALCYKRGDGVDQDWKQAIDLYRRAAELGNSRAMNSLALCYERGDGVEQDWEQAIDLYRRATELGNSRAMNNLAVCYERGDGVEQNWKQAISLYRQSAELGNSRAMTNLAVCYEHGEGVEQDWEQAIDLYRRAAELGNSRAMTSLAICYEHGEGVKQDWEQAIDLYHQAADLDHNGSIIRLALLYQEGERIEQDWSKAIALYNQAINLGNRDAMYGLGLCYESGKGIERDWNRAIALYRQAAELGDSRAMNQLAHCYQYGYGVEPDWSEAIALYRQAADLGHSQAMIKLASCYEHGDGVEQDWNEAITLCRHAVDLGDTKAALKIPVLLFLLGVTSNKHPVINAEDREWANHQWISIDQPIDSMQTQASNDDGFDVRSKVLKELASFYRIARFIDSVQAQANGHVDFYARDKILKVLAIFHHMIQESRLDTHIKMLTCTDIRIEKSNFYPDCELICLEFINSDTGVYQYCNAILSDDNISPIMRDIEFFQGVNPYLIELSSDSAVRSYTHFILDNLSRNENLVCTLREFEDLKTECTQGADLDIYKSFFESTSSVDRGVSFDGWQASDVFVLYQEAILKAQIEVLDHGGFEILDSELLAKDLPIRKREYNGIFWSYEDGLAHAEFDQFLNRYVE